MRSSRVMPAVRMHVPAASTKDGFRSTHASQHSLPRARPVVCRDRHRFGHRSGIHRRRGPHRINRVRGARAGVGDSWQRSRRDSAREARHQPLPPGGVDRRKSHRRGRCRGHHPVDGSAPVAIVLPRHAGCWGRKRDRLPVTLCRDRWSTRAPQGSHDVLRHLGDHDRLGARAEPHGPVHACGRSVRIQPTRRGVRVRRVRVRRRGAVHSAGSGCGRCRRVDARCTLGGRRTRHT